MKLYKKSKSPFGNILMKYFLIFFLNRTLKIMRILNFLSNCFLKIFGLINLKTGPNYLNFSIENIFITYILKLTPYLMNVWSALKHYPKNSISTIIGVKIVYVRLVKILGQKFPILNKRPSIQFTTLLLLRDLLYTLNSEVIWLAPCYLYL